MRLKNYITNYHTSTKRDYLERMNNDKVNCMIEAKKYSKNYWDGDRKYGYGGYKYIPGKWKPLAKDIISNYNLSDNSKILDVGCGKGYLLLEIKKLLPKIQLTGIDISKYALDCAPKEIKDNFFIHNAKDKLPFDNDSFDLVISINTIHNLKLYDVQKCITEIERVGKEKYLVTESFRIEKEQFNLQCWALTCESFFDETTWIDIFNNCNYTGDYELIYFE